MKGRAFIDGGARGNPGPAGIGAILDGPKPITISEYLGSTTNNIAEYTALVRLLQESLRRGYTDLDIYADSELVVKQLKGLYKVKNAKLKDLFLEAQKYLQQLKCFTITHIRRELNAEADKLVNEAIDNGLN